MKIQFIDLAKVIQIIATTKLITDKIISTNLIHYLKKEIYSNLKRI